MDYAQAENNLEGIEVAIVVEVERPTVWPGSPMAAGRR